ncbi:MAG TPA: endonuclease domain-containing protein, partial [Xanthomonadales bacterium]|nr:endonuclease domain-containing protein [Xanthomonadales bacterium]
MAIDPKQSTTFRFVRSAYADGVAELVYAFDDGEELVERVTLPDAPAIAAERVQPLKAALRLLHLVAGVSYYKAGVPERIAIDGDPIDAPTAALLEQLYEHGLGEFAYQNGLDLRGRIRFPHAAS